MTCQMLTICVPFEPRDRLPTNHARPLNRLPFFSSPKMGVLSRGRRHVLLLDSVCVPSYLIRSGVCQMPRSHSWLQNSPLARAITNKDAARLFFFFPNSPLLPAGGASAHPSRRPITFELFFLFSAFSLSPCVFGILRPTRFHSPAARRFLRRGKESNSAALPLPPMAASLSPFPLRKKHYSRIHYGTIEKTVGSPVRPTKFLWHPVGRQFHI